MLCDHCGDCYELLTDVQRVQITRGLAFRVHPIDDPLSIGGVGYHSATQESRSPQGMIVVVPDEADVQDALTQARSEMHNDILQHRLDYQVEQGLITQEQADEYLEWYMSRPEGFSPRHFRGFGGFKFHRGWIGGSHVESSPQTETESSGLSF